MRKTSNTLIMLFAFVFCSNAQENIPSLNLPNFKTGESSVKRTYFDLVLNKISIKFKTEATLNEKQEILSRYSLEYDEKHLPSDKSVLYVLNVNSVTTQIQLNTLIAALNDEPKIDFASHFVKYIDGKLQSPTNELVLKLKSPSFLEATKELLRLKGVSFKRKIESTPNCYMFTIDNITSSEKSFQICNELFGNPMVDFIEPNFLRLDLKSTNDTYYSQQWALKNNEQNGGVAGEDIDIEEAWTLTDGNPLITIGILDDGIDPTHPDFPILSLLSIEDFVEGPEFNNGLHAYNDAHGTACAGIMIAKRNNSTGIAGLAPDCKIHSYRISYNNFFYDDWTYNAFVKAINDNVNVINCSFGGGASSWLLSNIIHEAVFPSAGQGAVVVAASGNVNVEEPEVPSIVEFPASHSDVIAVGGSNWCEERVSPTSCDGLGESKYGYAMEVVAPFGKIYTTDRVGTEGYSTGDYESDFSGTSASAPIVSSIAALILSVQTSMYSTQVRFIIGASADEIGDYNYTNNSDKPSKPWNIEVGYGRVNAKKALEMASGLTLPLGGPSDEENDCIQAQLTIPLPVEIGTNTFYGFGEYNPLSGNCGTVGSPSNGATHYKRTLKDALGNIVSVLSGCHCTNGGPPTFYLEGIASQLPLNYNFSTPNTTYSLLLEVWDQERVIDLDFTPATKNDYSYYDAIEKTFTVTDCSGFEVNVSQSSGSICHGQSVSFNAVATGGTAPYSYTWKKINGLLSPTISSIPNPVFNSSNYSAGLNHYVLVVTDAYGCKKTQDYYIQVQQLVVSHPDEFKVCFGNPVTFDISVTGDGPFTYLWVPSMGPDSQFDDNQTQDPLFSPTVIGDGHVWLDVQDNIGCGVELIIPLHVYPTTIYSASAGVDQTICEGGNLNLSGSVTPAAFSPYTYVWSIGSTEVASGQNVQLNPNGPLTVTLNVMDNHMCPAVSDDMVVTIDPALNPILEFGPPDLTFCSSLVVTLPFPGNISNATPPITFLWNHSSTSNTYTFGPNAGGVVNCLITDANGCTAYDEVGIYRNSAMDPIVSLNYDNETTVCPGGTAVVSSNVTNVFSSSTYSWSDGQTGATGFFITEGIQVLTVTDADGCSGSAQINIDLPIPWYTSGKMTTLCGATGTNWPFTTYGGTPPYTAYQWYPNYNISSATSATPTFTPDVSTIYSVVVTDSRGCVSTPRHAFIKVYSDEPSVSFTSTPDIDCGASLVCLDNTINTNLTTFNSFGNPFELNPEYQAQLPTLADNNTELTWTFSDPILPYSNPYHSNDPCVQFASEGSHLVTLSVNNTCGVNSVAQTVYSFDYPYGAVPLDLSICGNIPASLSSEEVFLAKNKITAPNCSPSYNTILQNETVQYYAGSKINFKPGFHAKANTYFIARIKPCLLTKNEEVLEEELDVFEGFSVFPNPTNGQTTIQIDNFDAANKNYKLVLYNSVGQLMQQINVTSNKMDVDLSNYENGIYLLSFSDGITTSVVRISKTN